MHLMVRNLFATISEHYSASGLTNKQIDHLSKLIDWTYIWFIFDLDLHLKGILRTRPQI